MNVVLSTRNLSERIVEIWSDSQIIGTRAAEAMWWEGPDGRTGGGKALTSYVNYNIDGHSQLVI